MYSNIAGLNPGSAGGQIIGPVVFIQRGEEGGAGGDSQQIPMVSRMSVLP